VIELASPVVQVVTVGTDWPAIVAAISGGVVGLAGIIFAWRQSNKTISAEDARARVAEKRRIYANCLSMFTLGFSAGVDARRLKDTPQSDEYRNAMQEFNRARPAAMNAVQEVDLIGPLEVGRLARKAGLSMLQIPKEGAEDFIAASREVLLAMRADLGEPQE
jgi:hypothetical protein